MGWPLHWSVGFKVPRLSIYRLCVHMLSTVLSGPACHLGCWHGKFQCCLPLFIYHLTSLHVDPAAVQAAPALLPPSSGIPPALPLLIELGCSFGNTVTLPLLYLMTMLPAADASRAAGFMSLFHAAWSPCLWVFGYSRVQEVSRSRQQQGPKRPKPGGQDSRVHTQQQLWWLVCSVVLLLLEVLKLCFVQHQ